MKYYLFEKNAFTSRKFHILIGLHFSTTLFFIYLCGIEVYSCMFPIQIGQAYNLRFHNLTKHMIYLFKIFRFKGKYLIDKTCITKYTFHLLSYLTVASIVTPRAKFKENRLQAENHLTKRNEKLYLFVTL